MYFPYVRGRQYELLALRELAEHNLLGSHVVPIVEPVKLSPTLIKTMDVYAKGKHPIAVIRNPAVGSFMTDISDAKPNTKEGSYKDAFHVQCNDKSIIKAIIMQENAQALLTDWNNSGVDKTELLIINNDREYLDLYEHEFTGTSPRYVLVPDESAFRRKARHNRVLLDDKFEKQKRNADYGKEEDEFFSDDHLYFRDDEFKGFSDYSVVGNEFLEAGFAPYAVAIHIVYFASGDNLRVRHFVSDSNEDIADPAKKFYEAVSKLAAWYQADSPPVKITQGLQTLLEHHANKTYPGLGSVKKLSLMHHLELMGKYLGEGK